MKLQLKHLDFVNNGKVRLFNNLILYSKDVNLQDCKLGFDGNKQPYLMHENIPYYLDEIKPYKRNLNQLTQEIEHDGVRFVPLVELQNYSDGSVHMDDWLEHIDDFSYKPHEIDFEQCPYIFIQKLQEWHFAIDIPSEMYIEMEAIPTTKPNIA